VIAPASEQELAEAVRVAEAPLLVQGNGTKAGMLRPVQAAATLSTKHLTRITLYAPKELVMSAQAGTRLCDIEAELANAGQQMIAEPPLIAGEEQTIGGIVATNFSGPRRVTGGAMRDHVLGVRAVNGHGEILRFGGRVLKNVTGLDVSKLLTGSHGTLAVMTEITFKVLPVTEATGTVVLRGLDAARGVAALSAGLGSPFSVSAAAYLPAERKAVLRIEDFAVSVKYRTEKLATQLKEFGAAEILDTAASKSLWRDLRDCRVLDAGDAVWRVSVPPSAGPGVLRAVEALGVTGFLDWGGGLVWLTGPADTATHAAVCAAARAGRGVWWLMRAPEPLRAVVDVVPPESPALAAIRRRVEEAFDPRGIFNPGRMRAA
jgi:glycolate oxidase FAD binding subunit